MSFRYRDFGRYVPVAERRAMADRETVKLRAKGRTVSPVVITGRAIAKTFWGKAWCDNLESYRDYETRLPRGRTYVRNGSVFDLQITPKTVQALVTGSEIYRVTIEVTALPAPRWQAICAACAGGIESLVALLQGRLSGEVMAQLSCQDGGLFPRPSEIQFACSCPDYAVMCKHVAAVLYGVGARLDDDPALLFTLRAVDPADLVTDLRDALPLAAKPLAPEKRLEVADLSALFGLDLVDHDDVPPEPAATATPAAPAVKTDVPAPRPAKRRARKTKAADRPYEVTPDGYVKWWT